ncbi:Ubiquitin carboxyl-terminal hydrolase isozyme L3 [Desmophyllum pertusum]|uniref:Ubiquitin carboxyl-terminal hydrolase n=1 Tax=Desmophyllum pertusum TaxID=174260 RepID=A0A9W9ZXH1_9CNID|nr:Ubiquitin carboxyl-terminal hydrolase isozyme L3 [Desmophyllum pertusum]
MVRWLPLESNPDFITNLGLKPSWSFVDVFGLDPEMLAMLPQPTCALLLLFPTSDKYHEFKTEQEAKVKEKGQEVSPNVYFMKQTIGNACGTVAMIHSIANNTDVLQFDDKGFLKNFIDSTQSLSPEEKGEKLENDEVNNNIYSLLTSVGVHEACAQEGQTETPSAEEHVDLHFVAIVHKDGSLYELGCSWGLQGIHEKRPYSSELHSSCTVQCTMRSAGSHHCTTFRFVF